MEVLFVNKAIGKEKLDHVFDIFRIVFVEEMGWVSDLEFENNGESTHFLAMLDNQSCGASEWTKTDQGYTLKRFAVLKAFRGKRIEEALIAVALADLPADAHYIHLNARLADIPLCAKFGFVVEGSTFEEIGLLDFKKVKMVKKI